MIFLTLVLLTGCAAPMALDCGPFPVEYDKVVKEWAAKRKAMAPIQSISFPVKSHGKDDPPGWQVIVETKFGIRDPSLLRSKEFVEKVDEIWNLVRDEAIKAQEIVA